MSIILNKLRVGLNDKRLENQNTLAVMAIMHLLGPTESLLRNNLLKLCFTKSRLFKYICQMVINCKHERVKMISTSETFQFAANTIVIKATHLIDGSSCQFCDLTDLIRSGVSIVMGQIVSASNTSLQIMISKWDFHHQKADLSPLI